MGVLELCLDMGSRIKKIDLATEVSLKEHLYFKIKKKFSFVIFNINTYIVQMKKYSFIFLKIVSYSKKRLLDPQILGLISLITYIHI